MQVLNTDYIVYTLPLFFFTVEPVIPKMDIVFAISANSIDADETFTLMKDSIRTILNDFKFGNGNVKYAVSVHGSTIIQLGDPSFGSIKDLRASIERLTRQSRDPDLEKTLEEGLKIFQSPAARPGVKQVMVVLTDKQSTSSDEAIQRGAKLLDESNVRVIPVAIGSEADTNQLIKITPFRDDLIQAMKDKEPWILAREIIIKAFKGK